MENPMNKLISIEYFSNQIRVFGSAMIPPFPPPCLTSANADFKVIALANLNTSSVLKSGAILIPPIAGPRVTLSTTSIPFNFVFGL